MEISKLYYAFGIGFEDSHMRDLFSEYMMNAKKELLVFREEKIPAMDSGEDYKDYYDNKLKQHGWFAWKTKGETDDNKAVVLKKDFTLEYDSIWTDGTLWNTKKKDMIAWRYQQETPEIKPSILEFFNKNRVYYPGSCRIAEADADAVMCRTWKGINSNGVIDLKGQGEINIFTAGNKGISYTFDSEQQCLLFEESVLKAENDWNSFFGTLFPEEGMRVNGKLDKKYKEEMKAQHGWHFLPAEKPEHDKLLYTYNKSAFGAKDYGFSYNYFKGKSFTNNIGKPIAWREVNENDPLTPIEYCRQYPQKMNLISNTIEVWYVPRKMSNMEKGD